MCFENRSRAFCAGPRHFGVVPPRGVFRVDIYPVTGHESMQQMTLTDTAFRTGVGSGCLTIQSSNMETVTLQLGETVVQLLERKIVDERRGANPVGEGDPLASGAVSKDAPGPPR